MGDRLVDSITKIDVGSPPFSTGWKAFDFNFHNFESTIIFNRSIADISCFGCDYRVCVKSTNRPLPAAEIDEAEIDGEAREMCVAYLYQTKNSTRNDDDIDIECDAEMIGSDGHGLKMRDVGCLMRQLLSNQSDQGAGQKLKGCFLHPFQEVINPENFLLSDGTLVVRIYMKKKGPKNVVIPAFIPTNPFHKVMVDYFMDEKHADVLFEIGKYSSEGDECQSERFYAHLFILRACAPTLAEMCEGKGDLISVTIPDVKPEVFQILLCYIYGGKVSCKMLTDFSREIVDAADRYDIANLKVEAEVTYVKTTTITMENVLDNFYFADTKKCALLKEKVMGFVLDHGDEVLSKFSARELPQSQDMLGDILTAIAQANAEDKDYDGDDATKLKTMPINTLRRKLHARGLGVEGTREMLVTAVENSFGLD